MKAPLQGCQHSPIGPQQVRARETQHSSDCCWRDACAHQGMLPGQVNARLQKMEADGQGGDPAFPKQQVYAHTQCRARLRHPARRAVSPRLCGGLCLMCVPDVCVETDHKLAEGQSYHACDHGQHHGDSSTLLPSSQ